MEEIVKVRGLKKYGICLFVCAVVCYTGCSKLYTRINRLFSVGRKRYVIQKAGGVGRLDGGV